MADDAMSTSLSSAIPEHNCCCCCSSIKHSIPVGAAAWQPPHAPPSSSIQRAASLPTPIEKTIPSLSSLRHSTLFAFSVGTGNCSPIAAPKSTNCVSQKKHISNVCFSPSSWWRPLCASENDTMVRIRKCTIVIDEICSRDTG